MAADALSRCISNDELTVVSECVPTWIQKLKEGYEDDPETQQLLTDLTIIGSNSKGYSLHNGVIRIHGRVWVGNNTTAQQHILTALHASGLGGHSGITTTYIRVKQLFAWPGLKQMVTTFVKPVSDMLAS
jgi:hypothetical protein